MSSSAWLIDMGYVVKSAATAFKIDYVAARDLLAERFGPIDAFLFNSFDQRLGVPEGLQAFYDAMRHQGMKVRLHPMSGTPGGTDHRQRRVDVDLAAHMIWQASLPDIRRVILTSGDQDLIPAVEMVQDKFGKEFVLFLSRLNVHRELRAAADHDILFEDHETRLAR